MQKTSLRERASREELTAMVSSMGSSGGMTEVTIMVQFRNSLKRLRSGSCSQAVASVMTYVIASHGVPVEIG